MKKIIAAVGVLMIMTATALASSYVGNANTHKFHYADCYMVNKMNPKNKVFINTREEAIKAGYVPCKRCKP